MSLEIEEGTDLKLDFNKLRLVAQIGQRVLPAVAQDAETGEVLIIGYANQKALDVSMQSGYATFWSTSRDELWKKGERSGDMLELQEIRVNCEQNAILYLVKPVSGKSCHTKDHSGENRRTCFYRRMVGKRLQYI